MFYIKNLYYNHHFNEVDSLKKNYKCNCAQTHSGNTEV